MQYRDIAKEVIKEYTHFLVDSGYDFPDYDVYKDVFYTVLSDIMRVSYEDKVYNEKIKEIEKGYRKILKEKDLLRHLKHNKEITFNIVKALFDIVFRDLNESGGLHNDM